MTRRMLLFGAAASPLLATATTKTSDDWVTVADDCENLNGHRYSEEVLAQVVRNFRPGSRPVAKCSKHGDFMAVDSIVGVITAMRLSRMNDESFRLQARWMRLHPPIGSFLENMRFYLTPVGVGQIRDEQLVSKYVFHGLAVSSNSAFNCATLTSITGRAQAEIWYPPNRDLNLTP